MGISSPAFSEELSAARKSHCAPARPRTTQYFDQPLTPELNIIFIPVTFVVPAKTAVFERFTAPTWADSIAGSLRLFAAVGGHWIVVRNDGRRRKG